MTMKNFVKNHQEQMEFCAIKIFKKIKKMYNKKIFDHNNIIRLILVEIRVI